MRSTAGMIGAIIVGTCFFTASLRHAEGLFSGGINAGAQRTRGPRLRKLLGEDEQQLPPPTPPTTRRPRPGNADDVIRQQLGGKVRKMKYDNQLYKGLSGGPITDGGDLECNFEGFCCWQNVDRQKSSSSGQFDWFWAKGDPDSKLLKANFGASRKPSGRYLIAVRQSSSSTDEALFISCTIPCTTRPIKIHFRHWTTSGVQLQVCSSETFFNDNNKVQLINCQDVKRSESPGLSTVTIPPGELTDIVFAASNFRNQYGGVAIIDDITADITPCENKPKP